MLASTMFVLSEACKSYESIPTTCVRGNKAHGIFSQKLDGEDGMERFRRGLPRGTLETHLA